MCSRYNMDIQCQSENNVNDNFRAVTNTIWWFSLLKYPELAGFKLLVCSFYYLTQNRNDNGVYTFTRSTMFNKNIIPRQDFELTFFEATVQLLNYYATGDNPKTPVSCWLLILLRHENIYQTTSKNVKSLRPNTALSLGLTLSWLFILLRGMIHPERNVLFKTRKSIGWWGFTYGDLESVEYPFITITLS